MRLLFILVLLACGSFTVGIPAAPGLAHGGGVNAQGCHNNRKTGDYHCHRGKSSAGSPFKIPLGNAPFANCTAARQAGAAPVRRGAPGYGRHLDRDDDGLGCE